MFVSKNTCIALAPRVSLPKFRQVLHNLRIHHKKSVDDISKAKKSTTDKAKSKSKSDTSADKEKKDKKKTPLDSGEKNIKNVEDEDKVDESNKPPEGYDEVPDEEFKKLYKGEHSQNFHGYISGYCLTVI